MEGEAVGAGRAANEFDVDGGGVARVLVSSTRLPPRRAKRVAVMAAPPPAPRQAIVASVVLDMVVP